MEKEVKVSIHLLPHKTPQSQEEHFALPIFALFDSNKWNCWNIYLNQRLKFSMMIVLENIHFLLGEGKWLSKNVILYTAEPFFIEFFGRCDWAAEWGRLGGETYWNIMNPSALNQSLMDLTPFESGFVLVCVV